MPDGPDRRTGYEKFFGKSYRSQVNDGCITAIVVTILFIIMVPLMYGCMYAIASSG